MRETIIAEGKIFELVQSLYDDGRVFEVARRAPGVRLIITDTSKKQILLTKEFRHELNGWDFRLPGGKVFDTLDELKAFREGSQDIRSVAEMKAKQEGAEEAGVDVRDVVLFKVSTLGATVQWDLYIYEVTDWTLHADGQQLEQGEQIEANNWFSYDEVRQMILSGQMQEERVALILLQWLELQRAS